MSVNLRIRLGLRMVVGPFHPTGKADVFLTIEPEPDGSARVDISRIIFPKNPIFTAAGGFFKNQVTTRINNLIAASLKDIPRYMPQVEEVTILEISNE